MTDLASQSRSPFEVDLPPSPYPGMRPFEKRDWPVFFGRETMTDEVITRLLSHSFVLVHGDSGSGKSSLIRAGVQARLEQEQARSGRRWFTADMRPGETPLWGFARSLADASSDDTDSDRVRQFRRLLNLGRDAGPALVEELDLPPDQRLCVLVDQFEELFRFASEMDPDEARLFTDVLVGLQRAPQPGLYLSLTMRSEFLGACARFRGLAEAVNDSQYLLPQMEHTALLRAIREPALLYGWEIDTRLANAFVEDAGGAQDQLPLIQHGLLRLWLRRNAADAQSARSTRIRYWLQLWLRRNAADDTERGPGEARSGSFRRLEFTQDLATISLTRLLSDHADRVMDAVAPPADAERVKVVEYLFRALTDINADGNAIRRPQTFDRLVMSTASDPDTLRAIVDAFRAEGVSFLTPYGSVPIQDDSPIDISHEALIRRWGRIADAKTGWLRREFDDGLKWKSLRVQAQGFRHDPGQVLSPAAVQETEAFIARLSSPAWSLRYGGEWEQVEDLLEASRRARDIQEARERKHREREQRLKELELREQLHATRKELDTERTRASDYARQVGDLSRQFGVLEAQVWVWRWVRAFFWLVPYSTFTVLGIAYLFLFNVQGQQLLQETVNSGLLSLWNLMLLIAAVSIALILRFTTRLLIRLESRRSAGDTDVPQLVQIWAPRMLGSYVPFVLATGFVRVPGPQAGFEVGLINAGVFFVVAVSMLRTFQRSLMNSWEREGLSKSEILLAVALLGLWLITAIAFMVWPVSLPQTIGAPALILFGFAGIALFGNLVLTYAFRVNGYTGGTLLMLVLAAAFLPFNDNHWVRLAEDAPRIDRSKPAEHYQRWQKSNARHRHEIIPLVLVAASGAGARAAYWTGSVLAELESIPGFSDNLFAISGVSGGGVGATAYVALRRKQLETGDGTHTIGEEIRSVLSTDFISPLVAGLLFPDLLQRFMPMAIAAADRQRFLELSWEEAFGQAVDDQRNLFSRPFTELYSGVDAMQLPALLLNATVVNTGGRALISNLDLGNFVDTRDLLDSNYTTHAVLVSAAAGIAARDGWVSPFGLLKGTTEGEERIIRVGSGSEYDPSGTVALLDTLAQLPDLWQSEWPVWEANRQRKSRVVPTLILISSDARAPGICERSSDSRESEWPSRGWDRRLRRESINAAQAIERQGGAVFELPIGVVLNAQLAQAESPERPRYVEAASSQPVLRWSLPLAVREVIDRVLDQRSGGLDNELAMLAGVLNGTMDAYVPCLRR